MTVQQAKGRSCTASRLHQVVYLFESFNDHLHVWSSAIADLQGILIKDIPKFVAGVGMFVHMFEKFLNIFSLDNFALCCIRLCFYCDFFQ